MQQLQQQTTYIQVATASLVKQVLHLAVNNHDGVLEVVEHRCRHDSQLLTYHFVSFEHARQRCGAVQGVLHACSCSAISHVRTRAEMLLAQAVYLLFRRPIVRRRFKTAVQQYVDDSLPFCADLSILQIMTLCTHVLHMQPT
jgi:hypothetical protein